MKKVVDCCLQHRVPDGFLPSYGTAGFRADASLLTSTVVRCGVLTAARAVTLRKACGLMVTASHNQQADNGVKLVEPNGEMLCQEWESLATRLAQAQSEDEIKEVLDAILPRKFESDTADVSVLIAHDTRPSAATLVAAAIEGVESVGVKVIQCNLATTPQLHYMVLKFNELHDVNEKLYIDTLTNAFKALTKTLSPSKGRLFIDCANGVGSCKLEPFVDPLRTAGWDLVLRNKGEGELNHMVGADYVQKQKVPPQSFSDIDDSRCCSIDGDADRLVYFDVVDGLLRLYDGDKIATLAAMYVRKQLNELPESMKTKVQVGIVQTAYANGASTAFITDHLKLAAACTPTGVKHLHHVAKEFDIGIYFEANGHGTVLFSSKLLEELQEVAASCEAAANLLSLSQLINQTTGDAISGILMVEVILSSFGWTMSDWAALYTDLPSRMSKLEVKDRSAITTTDAERKVVLPPELQPAIDAAVAKYKNGRAFVRPSGTEDIVRVYAEASSQEDADQLAVDVARVTYDLAGGVGDRP